MKAPFSVSLIMPAFNEAENLPLAVRECMETLSTLTSQYEIIVVDDCSTDATQEVLSNLQQDYPSLKVIRNEHNLGCHPSALVGFKAAYGEVLIFLPADRQIPPNNILKFISSIDAHDLVCSYRRERIDSSFRRFASRLYNIVLRFCCGMNLHDTHSAIAVKKKVVKAIADEVQSHSAFAGCEFILRALTAGFSVTEIEIDHLPRISGKAKGANLRDAILTPVNLLEFLWKIQEKHNIKNIGGIART